MNPAENLISLLTGEVWISKLLMVVVALIIIWVIVKLLQRTWTRVITDNDTSYKAKKFSSFLGYLLAILVISIIYSDRLGGLTVALGVAGAGITFALQEVIVSFAGWLTIVFGRFYTTGDRVQLGGIRGDVMDIGILRTTIMETGEWVNGDLYNGRIVLVANSFVFKEPVFNYSGEFPFLWDEIKVPIHYGSDYKQAMKIIEDAGRDLVGELSATSKANWKKLQKRYKLEDARTDIIVSLAATDNWMEYTLRYVVDYKKRRSMKTQLFMRIIEDIEASKGQVRMASATFEITGLPRMDIDLDRHPPA